MRYYDPANHRFLNADSCASTGQGFVGNNMFAYCNNDPVGKTDSSGTRPFASYMLTDSGRSSHLTSPIISRNSFNEVHQAMLADIESQTTLGPLWYGNVTSVTFQKVEDYEVTYLDRIGKGISTFFPSLGIDDALSAASKGMARVGSAATAERLARANKIAGDALALAQAIAEATALPVGIYDQYSVSISGWYDTNIYGVGVQTTFYQHSIIILVRNIGNDRSYKIMSENFVTWR